MDLTKLKNSLPEFIKKYKYAVLILAVGILLMALPSGNSARTDPPTVEQQSPAPSIREELEAILSQIQGAGEVRVMLTEKTGQEYVYQTDVDTTVSENSQTQRTETVTISDADRNDQGLLLQVRPATYLGAVVLCQGAEDPTVKLAVADAVSKLTGLGLDKIAVIKMT